MTFQNWMRGRTIVYNPVPKTISSPSKRFHVGRILWQALKRTCMLLGAVMLISTIIGVVTLSRGMKQSAPPLPNDMVLVQELEGGITEERGPSDYFAEFGLAPQRITLDDIVASLDHAATDARVKAYVLVLRAGDYNLAQIQEIRAALLRFKQSKKPTYVFAASYGESGSGLGAYYLASVFDHIWMQPIGTVTVLGLNAKMPYFKNLMTRFGVDAQFFQRKDYKTAMENFTSNGMSPASREMTKQLMGDLVDQMTDGVIQSRPQLANFDSLIDQGLFTDIEAKKIGLVDHLGYSDELIKAVQDKINGKDDSELINFTAYSSAIRGEKLSLATPQKTVAQITIAGVIAEADMGASPLTMNQNVTKASTIASAIREAGKDDTVSAIMIRLNSPGGTPTAAETIRRAIIWVRQEHKKPVYIAMGATAASGGYWVASASTRIFALPSTLTGSIGVVGGKINIQKLLQEQNVPIDGVSFGANASMLSPFTPFTVSEQAQFEKSLDRVYDYFVKIVADGRKMTASQVESLAQGRVWTGRQAKGLKLVDDIGDANDAYNALAKAIGTKDRSALRIVYLPEPESPFKALVDLIEQGAPFSLSKKMETLIQTFSGRELVLETLQIN